MPPPEITIRLLCLSTVNIVPRLTYRTSPEIWLIEAQTSGQMPSIMYNCTPHSGLRPESRTSINHIPREVRYPSLDSVEL